MLGFFLDSKPGGKEELGAAIGRALFQELDINYCVVSENARGDPERFDMQLLRAKVTEEHVNWLLPHPEAGYLGSGYWCIRMNVDKATSTFCHLKGIITNKANESCTSPVFRVLFRNDAGQVVHAEQFKTGRLPIGESKSFEQPLQTKQISNFSTIEIIYLQDDD